MSRKNDDCFFSQLTQQIIKTVPLRRIKTGRRFINYDKSWISYKRLGNTKSLFHTTGISTEMFFSVLRKIYIFQQTPHQFLSLSCISYSFQLRDMVQHPFGRNFWVYAEFLREITQQLS